MAERVKARRISEGNKRGLSDSKKRYNGDNREVGLEAAIL